MPLLLRRRTGYISENDNSSSFFEDHHDLYGRKRRRKPQSTFYVIAILLLGNITLVIYCYKKQHTSTNQLNHIEWNWYHYSTSNNHNTTTTRNVQTRHTGLDTYLEFTNTKSNTTATRKVLISQYTGLDAAYLEFTNITQRANKAYANKWNYDYLLMKGTAFNSNQVGISAYNKLSVLRKAIDAKVYDVLLILDSDAVIVDLDQDVLDLMPESMLLTACRNHESDSPHTWNLNNGVTLWNLRHERMEEVYTEWYRRIIIRIGKKNLIPSDQAELHEVVKEYGEDKRKTIVNAIYTYHFRFHEGSFVKHVVRSSSSTWKSAQDDLIRRKSILKEAVKDVCAKWNCD